MSRFVLAATGCHPGEAHFVEISDPETDTFLDLAHSIRAASPNRGFGEVANHSLRLATDLAPEPAVAIAPLDFDCVFSRVWERDALRAVRSVK